MAAEYAYAPVRHAFSPTFSDITLIRRLMPSRLITPRPLLFFGIRLRSSFDTSPLLLMPLRYEAADALITFRCFQAVDIADIIITFIFADTPFHYAAYYASAAACCRHICHYAIHDAA